MENKRGRGRPKGSPNKVTKALKDMILESLDKAGGVDYLVTQSRDSASAYLALVGKVLPLTLAGDPAAPLVVTSIELTSDEG